MNFQNLSQTLVTELDSSRWIDPYDTEIYSKRFIRGILKRALHLCPKTLYDLKILKKHAWDENYLLFGIAALNLNHDTLVREIVSILLNHNKIHWGLPIPWHVSGYIFPPGTLMSTTTSEVALFLVEVDKKLRIIGKDLLNKIAQNLYNQLRKMPIDNNHYFLSYTPIDRRQVNNANLLVASALGVIGDYTNDKQLLKYSAEIVRSVVDFLPDSGGVPYNLGDHIQSVDGYHQLFSIRALYYLNEINDTAREWYEKTLHFFETELADVHGTVFLNLKKNVIDLQPYAEALRLYGITKNQEKYEAVLNGLLRNLVLPSDKVVQRLWFLDSQKKLRIHSRVVFTRQGIARLIAGLSYRNAF